MAGEKEDDIIIEELQDEVVDAGEIDSTVEEKKEIKQNLTPVKKRERSGSDGNKKRGNDNQKQINALWLAKKEAIALAEQERAEKSQWQGMAATFAEENIATKRELLTNKLAAATTQEEVAKITAALSKVEAEGAQIERYKIENQVGAKQPQQQQRQPEQPPTPVEMNVDDLYENMTPSGKAWLDNNRDWYDPQSDNYNADMAQDITLYAQALERNPGNTPTGSRAYFNKINEYIKENWSDSVEENPDEAPVVEKKKSYAAPVGNRSAQNPAPGARKEYKITQAEKEFALSLDTKGKDGKPLSDTDKVKRFVTLREKIPASGPITNQSLKGA